MQNIVLFIIATIILANWSMKITLIFVGISIIVYILYYILKKVELENELKKCTKTSAFLKSIGLEMIDLFKFNGKEFKISNKQYAWDKIYNIKVIDYKLDKYTTFHGQKCLDGSPDMRYRHKPTDWKDNYTTRFTLEFNNNSTLTSRYSITQQLDKKMLTKLIEKYNDFLFIVQSRYFLEDYNNILNLKHRCEESNEKKLSFEKNKKSKSKLFNELSKHKNDFTQDQHKKYIELQNEINIISREIFDLPQYGNEYRIAGKAFLKKYKQLKVHTLSTKHNKDKVSKINKLFSDIDN